MHKKFGTVLDDKLLSEAKIVCQQNHTTLSHLLEESLRQYLRKKRHISGGLSSVEASFGILKVTPKKLKAISEEDIYAAD